MMDLKVIHSVLAQLEEERGIPKEKIIEAIELALATAYKKEYGKKGQIIRATFNLDSGQTEMFQVKVVVDESTVFMSEEEWEEAESKELAEGEVEKELYNPEKHILLSDARRIKKGVELGDEMV